MKIKCYYRKNLKMSAGKLAAQVGHVCKTLGKKCGQAFPECESSWQDDQIIVLSLSDKKFNEVMDTLKSTKYLMWHLQIDNGVTEIPPNTPTVVGFIESLD